MRLTGRTSPVNARATATRARPTAFLLSDVRQPIFTSSSPRPAIGSFVPHPCRRRREKISAAAACEVKHANSPRRRLCHRHGFDHAAG